MNQDINKSLDDDFDIGRIFRYALMNSKLISIFSALNT